MGLDASLVRSDGVVAWVTDAANEEDAAQTALQWFGKLR
jgi:hypothetical protein